VEAYDVDPWGRALAYGGPGPDGAWFTDDDAATADPVCRHLFTGRDLDPATGLYYYRARHYAPDLGVFTAKDPLLYAAGDMNLYRYCGGDPVGEMDPSGEILPLLLFAGLVAVGSFAAYFGANHMESRLDAQIAAQNRGENDFGFVLPRPLRWWYAAPDWTRYGPLGGAAGGTRFEERLSGKKIVMATSFITATFHHDVTDETIWSPEGDLVQAGGQSLAGEISKRLNALGYATTTAQLRDYYGWEFNAIVLNRRAKIVLEADGEKCRLVVGTVLPFFSRLRGIRAVDWQEPVVNALKTVFRDCEFRNVKWGD
jgi:RHS repeat-associated protein